MIETMDYSKGVSYWTVSDIFDEDKLRLTPFSGSYGLLTINGIPKATYHVFTMFQKMRGKKLDADLKAPKGCGILACEECGIVRVMLYNCNFPEIENQPVWTDTITVPNIEPDAYICEQAKIKEGHGSPYEEWLKMGKPENLTPFEEEYLRGCSSMEYSIVPISAGGEISFSLEPNEVCYFELHKKAVYEITKNTNELLENQLNTSNKK